MNDDVARLSPLKHANLNVLGRYSFRASTPAGGGLRRCATRPRSSWTTMTTARTEVEWARGTTQDDQHLLALLVWLKAY